MVQWGTAAGWRLGGAVERGTRVVARFVEEARRAVVALGVERVAEGRADERRVLLAGLREVVTTGVRLGEHSEEALLQL